MAAVGGVVEVQEGVNSRHERDSMSVELQLFFRGVGGCLCRIDMPEFTLVIHSE